MRFSVGFISAKAIYTVVCCLITFLVIELLRHEFNDKFQYCVTGIPFFLSDVLL
jgi:hypothetical protein